MEEIRREVDVLLALYKAQPLWFFADIAFVIMLPFPQLRRFHP